MNCEAIGRNIDERVQIQVGYSEGRGEKGKIVCRLVAKIGEFNVHNIALL